MRKGSRVGLVAVAATALVVGLAAGPARAAAGDDAKAAAAGKPAATSAAGSSSVGEEDELRAVAGAAGDLDSPGLFTGADRKAIVRSFSGSDRAAVERRTKAKGAAAVQASRFTKGRLNALEKQLRNASRRAGASYEFHYDAASDTVQVTGNLTDAELPAGARAAGEITVVATDGVEPQSRYADTQPYWGGAAIKRSDGARCSTAFTVRNSAGTYGLVTAGHCGAVGTTWTTNDTGAYVGTTTARAPYPTYDVSFISGTTYGSYIYMGDHSGYGMKVLGAGDPVVGAYYCTSGTTTNENCDKRVTSLNATVCTSDGCTAGLASYTGGALTQAGDSGAPLVLKTLTGVYARGVHKAVSGSTMYGERWVNVAGGLGVSIVL